MKTNQAYYGKFTGQKGLRGGFTLIELLVVIILIALLSGMTVMVVRTAMNSGKASTVQMQIQQLSMALDSYKAKVGEYPPDDFTDYDALYRHLRKRWPRAKYDSASGAPDVNGDDKVDIVDAFLYTFGINNAETAAKSSHISALLLWLGGMVDEKDHRPKGFCLSPTDPFGLLAGTPKNQREDSFFKFPAKSLKPMDGVPAYVLLDAPLIYFRAEPQLEYLMKDGNSKSWSSDTFGLALPFQNEDGSWCEAERFQLMHPGMDKTFSDQPKRVVGELTPADGDTIVNFVDTLEVSGAE